MTIVDYLVRYSDNRGIGEADTIRYNGIEVEDNEGLLTSKMDNNNCYTRTFSYDDLPEHPQSR